MFLSPKKIVDYCDVHYGMKVADFGSGTGSFSLPLAKRVGVHGTIYAIDIQKELLRKLHNEARSQKIENVEIILGDLEREKGSRLKDESVDRVFLINSFFQMENKDACILEIRRILKKGGKVFLVDWLDSFGGLGPHEKDIIITKDAVSVFEKHYFKKDGDFPAGDHHYGILFIK